MTKIQDVMQKIERDTERAVAKELSVITLVIGDNDIKKVFYVNGMMKELHVLSTLRADLKKIHSILMPSADKVAINTAIAEIDRDYGYTDIRRVIIPTHLYEKLPTKILYESYNRPPVFEPRQVIDVAINAMNKGAAEFEQEVGRPMTYSEMRAMYG